MPVTYNLIAQRQQHCPQLKKLLRYPDCHFKSEKFHGGGKEYNGLTNDEAIKIYLNLSNQC